MDSQRSLILEANQIHSSTSFFFFFVLSPLSSPTIAAIVLREPSLLSFSFLNVPLHLPLNTQPVGPNYSWFNLKHCHYLTRHSFNVFTTFSACSNYCGLDSILLFFWRLLLLLLPWMPRYHHLPWLPRSWSWSLCSILNQISVTNFFNRCPLSLDPPLLIPIFHPIFLAFNHLQTSQPVLHDMNVILIIHSIFFLFSSIQSFISIIFN